MLWYRLGRYFVEVNVSNVACAAASQGRVAPGDRINIARGTATVLGARRGCVWYRVDGESALYWTPAELADILEEKGKEKQEREGGGNPMPTALPDEGEEAMDFYTFASLVADERWDDIALDEALVDVVNVLCDEVGCDAAQLALRRIVDRVALKSRSDGGDDAVCRLARLPPELIKVRFCLLLALNNAVYDLLPLLDLSLGSTSPAGSVLLSGAGNEQAQLQQAATKALPLGQRVMRLRGLLFSRTKLQFWKDLLSATETYTQPAPDEYEHPAELETIKLNRVRAGQHNLVGLPPKQRLARSVFGQLLRRVGPWDPLRLRRAYSHLQDAGQKRAFFVNFEGEGVDDHGGPYRAAIQQALEEEVCGGALGLLQPCPNAVAGAMLNRDKLVFSSSLAAEEEAPPPQEQVEFFGRLIGVAVRHELVVAVSLPLLLWRPLVGLRVGWRELHEVDSYTANSLRRIEALSRTEWESGGDLWSAMLVEKSGEAERDEDAPPLLYEDRLRYVRKIEARLLRSSSASLVALAKGLGSVLPVEALALFSASELEILITGSPEIDLELLRRVTEYDGGVDENSDEVKFFWEALS